MHRSALILALGCGLLAPAQDVASDTFEVASIKPSGEHSVRGSDGGPGSRDPGRYSFGQATVLDLIMVGWQLDTFQILSKSPIDQQRFDVVATVPRGASREQFRTMMRHFLSDRFHLKFHLETRDFPGYEIVVAKGGLKLREGELTTPQGMKAEEVDRFPSLALGRPGYVSNHSTAAGYELVRLRAQQQPISSLSRMIRLPGEPIVDKTEIMGSFDFLLEYTRPFSGTNTVTEPPPAPDLFDALPRQLGLQLVPKKLPFGVLVIDSIDKSPTQN